MPARAAKIHLKERLCRDPQGVRKIGSRQSRSYKDALRLIATRLSLEHPRLKAVSL